jgi:hypothetical protein
MRKEKYLFLFLRTSGIYTASEKAKEDQEV